MGTVEVTAITGTTGMVMVMVIVIMGMVIITAIAIISVVYNSCWKWSPYGPVNVCYPLLI